MLFFLDGTRMPRLYFGGLLLDSHPWNSESSRWNLLSWPLTQIPYVWWSKPKPHVHVLHSFHPFSWLHPPSSDGLPAIRWRNSVVALDACSNWSCQRWQLGDMANLRHSANISSQHIPARDGKKIWRFHFYPSSSCALHDPVYPCVFFYFQYHPHRSSALVRAWNHSKSVNWGSEHVGSRNMLVAMLIACDNDLPEPKLSHEPSLAPPRLGKYASSGEVQW